MKNVEAFVIRVRHEPPIEENGCRVFFSDKVFVKDLNYATNKAYREVPSAYESVNIGDILVQRNMVCSKCRANRGKCIHSGDADYTLVPEHTPSEIGKF